MAVAVAVFLVLAAPTSGAADPPTQFVPGTTWTGDFPDPHVVRVGSTYYAYSTNTANSRIPVLGSTDLQTWRVIGDGLFREPAWSARRDLWAPAVARIGGAWRMYYTAPLTAEGKQCVTVASSSLPEGPFVDTSTWPLMCQLASNGSIDPFPFVDGDGQPWLLWKSEGVAFRENTRIWSIRLSADGRSVVGTANVLAETSARWEGPLIENPSMISVDGRSFLFYSANDWNSPDYAIGYAVCDGPAGPCRKSPNALLSSVGDELGPGSPTPFFDPDGHLMLAYHAWTAPDVGYPDGARSLRVIPLVAVGDQIFTQFSGDSVRGRAVKSIVSSRTGQGYALAAATGEVAVFGDAQFAGSIAGASLRSPIVGYARAAGLGSWLAASDGGVFAVGGAPFLGSTGGVRLNRPVVGVASTPSGKGYWMVASDGGIFSFGDARFAGSTGAIALNQPVVGMASTPSGNGYWMVASDGGIFSFGDARFFGSTGAIHLNKPVVGMASTPSGKGYWMVASDGGIFAFGDASFLGSTGDVNLSRPVVGMAAHPNGDGYWLAAADGEVFAFGAAPFRGAG